MVWCGNLTPKWRACDFSHFIWLLLIPCCLVMELVKNAMGSECMSPKGMLLKAIHRGAHQLHTLDMNLTHIRNDLFASIVHRPVRSMKLCRGLGEVFRGFPVEEA